MGRGIDDLEQLVEAKRDAIFELEKAKQNNDFAGIAKFKQLILKFQMEITDFLDGN